MLKKDLRNLFYFGLEPLKERYTHQLSKEWMPETFKKYRDKINFIDVEGEYDKNENIKVGYVLDAVGRGKYTMSQCSKFLNLLQEGKVRNGDIIFLQDFFTPGMDSVFYALDLYGIKIKLYSMLHAQTVDEYDFTYKMKDWMRHYELGLDNRHTGIFVGSTIHKEQLRQCGFKAPIHVVSLPIHKKLAKKVFDCKHIEKQKKVVFASRLDKEKNPYFMLKVAKEFLDYNPDWKWIITTSGKEIKSSVNGLVSDLYNYAKQNPRFVIKENLTKQEYYQELAESKILFNSSLQDYVSWTIIEATLFNCDVCFPNFRSFPDFLPESDMYKPFYWLDAVNLLQEKVCSKHISSRFIPEISDLGRQIEAYIIVNGIENEINIWHEQEYCKKLLDIL